MGSTTSTVKIGVSAGLLCLALGWIAPSPTSASASGRISQSRAATDGHRYFSYLPANDTPVVVDSFTGKSVKVKGAGGCTPEDINRGRVLLSCPGSKPKKSYVPQLEFRHRLASVKTGASRGLGAEQRFQLSTLGKYWAAGGFDTCGVSPHCTGTVYQNLKTRNFIRFGEGSPPPLGNAVDRKHLNSKPDVPIFDIGPTARKVVSNGRVAVVDDGKHLTLWRVGASPVRIGRSIGYCCEIPEFADVALGRVQFVRMIGLKRYLTINTKTLERHRGSLTGPASYRLYGDVLPFNNGLILSSQTNASSPDSPRFVVRVKRFH